MAKICQLSCQLDPIKLTVNKAVNFSQLKLINTLLILYYLTFSFVNFFELRQLLTTLFSRVVNCQLKPHRDYHFGVRLLPQSVAFPWAGVQQGRPGGSTAGTSREGASNRYRSVVRRPTGRFFHTGAK